jgi:plasmid stabilization system protein ParE
MLKRKLIWLTRAQIELLEILEFYEKRNGNANYSRKLYSEINKLLQLCRIHPFIGKRTTIDTVRMLVFSDYSVFYRVNDIDIVVIRIWNSKRDPADLKL